MTKAKGAKRRYIFALMLIAFIGISAAASLELSVHGYLNSSQPQATAAADQTSIPTNQTSSEITNSTDHVSTPSTQENSSLLTKDQALSIAMPIIEKYAAENNRTVLYVNASLCRMTNSTRGGPTLEQVLQGNISVTEAQKQFVYYPVWEIEAHFDMSIYGNVTYPEPWMANGEVTGYQVLVWADLGQVCDAKPTAIAIM